MSAREVVPLHQYEAFRIIVLRVIESFVYKSLDETISLLKITTVINNNPLTTLVRTQISPGRSTQNLTKVSIRDVILSITKIFQSSDIQILANNDNFKIKLSRPDFQALVDKHYGRYLENTVESIRDFEDDHDKVLKEIVQIEKGELDQVIIQEHKQTLAQRQQLQQQQQQQETSTSSQAQPQSQSQPQLQQQRQQPSSAPQQQVQGQQRFSPQTQVVPPTASQQRAQQTPQPQPIQQNNIQTAPQGQQPSLQVSSQSPPQLQQRPQTHPVPQQLKDVKTTQGTPNTNQPIQTVSKPSVQQIPSQVSKPTQPPASQNTTHTVPSSAPNTNTPINNTLNTTNTTKPTQVPIKSEAQPVEPSNNQIPDKSAISGDSKINNDKVKTSVKIDDDEVMASGEEDVKAPTPEATTPEATTPEELKSGRTSTRSSPRKTRATTRDEERDAKKEDSESEEESENENSKRSTRSQTDKRRKSFKDEEVETPARKRSKISSSDAPSSPIGMVHAPPNKKLQILSNPLIANISSYKYASTFLQPVQESNAPNYYDIIKEPRDLKTIRQMIKDGRIQNGSQLERDILLMFANAIMYNKTGSDVYNWSKEMQVETDKFLQLFKESENN